MKNRLTSPPWIFLGILILMLSISACSPTKSATEGMTPSPTEDAITQNTPTPMPISEDPTPSGAVEEPPGEDVSSPEDVGVVPVENTPTPTPAPVDTGAGSSGPTTHVVQAGETVYSISVRYSVSVDSIAAANNLGPHYTIYVGQTLVIPGDDSGLPPTAEPPPPGGCSTTHVVQPGENLFRIGLRYGHTVDELAAANPEIVNPNNIKVGQLICIP